MYKLKFDQHVLDKVRRIRTYIQNNLQSRRCASWKIRRRNFFLNLFSNTTLIDICYRFCNFHCRPRDTSYKTSSYVYYCNSTNYESTKNKRINKLGIKRVNSTSFHRAVLTDNICKIGKSFEINDKYKFTIINNCKNLITRPIKGRNEQQRQKFAFVNGTVNGTVRR